MDNYWVWVSLPYATYAIRVNSETEHVMETPPIAKWMVNKPYRECLRWIKNKKGTVEAMD